MSSIYISKDTKYYIEEVKKKYKVLNRKELRDLFERKNNGDLEARKELIEKSLYLVIPLALECSKIGFDLDDLIQIGNIALISSIDKFDINKSLDFSYYCRLSIIRRFARSVELFVNKGFTHEKQLSLLKLLIERQNELENFETCSSIEDLCKKLDLDYNKMNTSVELYDFNKKVNSLSANEDLICQDINDLHFDIEEVFENDDEKIILNKCINTMPLSKQEIIKIRFGFDGKEPLSPQETAEYYNISRQCVDDKEARRLRRIKKVLKKEYPEYYEKFSKERSLRVKIKQKIREA